MNVHHPHLNTIIITGCQRSGTTLLGQILGVHHNCFLIDEFSGLYPWYNAWISHDEQAISLLESSIIASAKVYLDERRRFSNSNHLVGVNVVAKAPNLAYSYLELSKHQPRPKILFVVRDCRAVVASMQCISAEVNIVENQIKLLKNRPNIIIKYQSAWTLLINKNQPMHRRQAALWMIKTQMLSEFSDCNLTPLAIKYEDLISNPSSEVSKMLNYLELPTCENMLRYSDILTGIGPGNTSRKEVINANSLFKWKSVLSKNQVDDVWEITKPLMQSLGY